MFSELFGIHGRFFIAIARIKVGRLANALSLGAPPCKARTQRPSSAVTPLTRLAFRKQFDSRDMQWITPDGAIGYVVAGDWDANCDHAPRHQGEIAMPNFVRRAIGHVNPKRLERLCVQCLAYLVCSHL
jgi:hypothetical protein